MEVMRKLQIADSMYYICKSQNKTNPTTTMIEHINFPTKDAEQRSKYTKPSPSGEKEAAMSQTIK